MLLDMWENAQQALSGSFQFLSTELQSLHLEQDSGYASTAQRMGGPRGVGFVEILSSPDLVRTARFLRIAHQSWMMDDYIHLAQNDEHESTTLWMIGSQCAVLPETAAQHSRSPAA